MLNAYGQHCDIACDIALIPHISTVHTSILSMHVAFLYIGFIRFFFLNLQNLAVGELTIINYPICE